MSELVCVCVYDYLQVTEAVCEKIPLPGNRLRISIVQTNSVLDLVFDPLHCQEWTVVQ